MADPAGESEHEPLRFNFDRRLKLEFHGSGITTDARLLAYRELNDALGLSCMRFRNNEVRLQLHAQAHTLANFMRTLALSEAVKHWSLTLLRQKLVKIGARIIGHGR